MRDGFCKVCLKYTPTSREPRNLGACRNCVRKFGIRECITCEKNFVGRPKTRWCCQTCNPHSAQSKFIILERDEFKCIYCGKSSIEDGVKLHVDHICPVNSGGQGRAFNLVTACAKCNLQKSSRELSEDIVNRLFLVVKERNKLKNINPQRLVTFR